MTATATRTLRAIRRSIRAAIRTSRAVGCTTLSGKHAAAVTPADLTALPVPAAFDRGFLYSPTLGLARCALDDRYLYDYRPGDLFEPMPDAPRGDAAGFAWWWDNVARTPAPDFLGLRAGDRITIQHATSTGPGEVLETFRFGALVRYPYPDPSRSGQMYVHRRNDNGHWY